MEWYGVRMLFRTSLEGRPRKRDAGYRAGWAVLEDRVVIVRARSFDAALRKAEREAERYAAHETKNAYGQRVVTKYMGVANAYRMYDPPAAGAEVYSSTRFVPSRLGRRAILKSWFDEEEGADRRTVAWMFISGAIKAGMEQELKKRASRRRRAARATRHLVTTG